MTPPSDDAARDGLAPEGSGPGDSAPGDSNGSAARPSNSDLARQLDRLWQPAGQPAGQAGAEGLLRSVAGYDLIRPLGHGAFGIVYLAEVQGSGERVAVKLPRPEVLLSEDSSKRFDAEVLAASRLEHPNIVRVRAAASTPMPFIASDYCEGPNLAQWLAEQGPEPDWRMVCRLLAPVADAVQHAHAAGVYHRDLKPENILLFPVGDADESTGDGTEVIAGFSPRVTDFGLAKVADEALSDTRSSLLIGTALYMAPEQIEGRCVDPAAADVYSLGVILFELLTGRMPVEGDNYLQLIDQTREGRKRRLADLRPDCPEGLRRIVARCLATNPALRYASAGGLAADLRGVARGAAVSARAIGFAERAGDWVGHPKRVPDAGYFSLWSHLLIAFWTIGVLVGWYLKLDIDIGEHTQSIRDIVILVSLMHLPSAWLGWQVTRGKRWALWVGLAYALLNLPGPFIPLFYDTIFFKSMYADRPYLSFGMHLMVASCFAVQAFLYVCAAIAARWRAKRSS